MDKDQRWRPAVVFSFYVDGLMIKDGGGDEDFFFLTKCVGFFFQKKQNALVINWRELEIHSLFFLISISFFLIFYSFFGELIFNS